MGTNFCLLVLFVLSDCIGIWNLWEENVYRRILHHLQCNYDDNKIPLVQVYRNKLSSDDIIIVSWPRPLSNKIYPEFPYLKSLLKYSIISPSYLFPSIIRISFFWEKAENYEIIKKK